MVHTSILIAVTRETAEGNLSECLELEHYIAGRRACPRLTKLICIVIVSKAIPIERRHQVVNGCLHINLRVQFTTSPMQVHILLLVSERSSKTGKMW